jgi:hypothetical protein
VWRVKWRDFLGIKQDAEFRTEAEAWAFVARELTPPLFVDSDADPEMVAEADEFWRSLDRPA